MQGCQAVPINCVNQNAAHESNSYQHHEVVKTEDIIGDGAELDAASSSASSPPPSGHSVSLSHISSNASSISFLGMVCVSDSLLKSQKCLNTYSIGCNQSHNTSEIVISNSVVFGLAAFTAAQVLHLTSHDDVHAWNEVPNGGGCLGRKCVLCVTALTEEHLSVLKVILTLVLQVVIFTSSSVVV